MLNVVDIYLKLLESTNYQIHELIVIPNIQNNKNDTVHV